jgi:hypothetical protein
MKVHSSVIFSNSFKFSSTKGLGHSILNREHLVYKDQELQE